MFRAVGLVTVILCAVMVIAALVGGAVVVWGAPGALSFDDYLKDMAMFSGALGLLGIGRGIHLASRDQQVAETIRHRARN